MISLNSFRVGLSDVSAKEQPGAEAKLLTQCELAKIKLSDRSEFTVIAKDYIKGGSKQRDLAVKISRREFEDLSADLVDRGLAEIDRLLEDVRLSRSDIELCIATGGMINVPAIWNGLIERFGARVPVLPNRDRIIAEGAAWIAHDGLRLTLAKPIEVLVADRTGRGTYVPLVAGGLRLPVENEILPAENRRFFCIDPRDGVAAFQFAKPRKVGLLQPTDERTILASLSLPIDPFARPFLERLECMVQIDHDYIGHVLIKSNGREESVAAEFHDLDFGLALPLGSGPRMPDLEAEEHGEAQKDGQPTGHRRNSNVALRSNVAERENWQLVPGDLVQNWKPEFFDRRSVNATEFQISEKLYYVPCARCGRTIYKINAEGPVEACHRYGCSEVARSSTNYQG